MKIISTFFYTVLIALIIGVAGLLLGTMLPIPGNIEVKIVKSGSMEPAIMTGSIVIVKPESSYKIGDVITFGKDTKTDVPTTHRIIAQNSDGTYTVKGDANEDPDPNPVQRSSVIGSVVFHVPYVGFVLDFARQPIGFTLLIAIPAALVILEELLTIFRETRRWMRRRNGDDDHHESAGGGPLDLRSHLKRVYEKRRAMDEIKVAVYHEPRVWEFAWWKHRLGLEKDAYGTVTSLTLGLVFASTLFAGQSGGTISYFQDIERSVNNLLQAGVWSPPAVALDEPPALSLSSLAPLEGEVLGADDAPAETAIPALTDEEAPPPLPEEPADAADASVIAPREPSPDDAESADEGGSTPTADLEVPAPDAVVE